jgi:Ca-activated chloride channel homolog
VVAIEQLRDRPVRGGFLLDTSESMRESLPRSKDIAKKFAERLFRHGTDAAFVSSFGYGSEVLQAWSDDPGPLKQSIQMARSTRNGEAGTAILNAVFQACSSSFAKVDPTASGNFIVLFSDGQDNAGLTSSDEAARACQRSNTAVFAFISNLPDQRVSTGPRLLREVAAKTGGRVFRADDSKESIWAELNEIDWEMRNQYRLVYRPAELKHDGAFHEIELQPPDRVKRVIVRSGHFAPLQ